MHIAAFFRQTVVVGFLILPAAVIADAQTLPDPAVCATDDGWLAVAKAFVIALPAAHDAGKLTDAQFTDLSVWFTQMQNWLMETNNTKAMCEQFLDVRRAWGI